MVRKGVTNILQPLVEASSEISSHMVDMKDFMELAKPFLSKGTKVAHIVNDGWLQIQAAHSALMNIVPKLGLLLFLILIGKCLGIRKRHILLTISALLYAAYAFDQIRSKLKPATSAFLNFTTKFPDYIRANSDVLAIVGLVIIAITFAIVSYFWVESLQQAREEETIKEEIQSLHSARRHDHHKSFTIDLGNSRHQRNADRDRSKRAETAPPRFLKSEWV